MFAEVAKTFAKKTKLSDEIMHVIMTKILNGEIASKVYLPSEKELCGIFKTSRVTVREAIRGLEERGFVERQHGKGAKVIDKSVEVVSDSLRSLIIRSQVSFIELLEVRKTIEIQTARLAAAKADKADIAAMELAIRDMYNPSSTDSEYTDSDMRFHQMIGSASKNKIFEAVVKSLSPFIHESIHATLPKSARPEPHLHLHGNILAAIKAGDADEAERQIRKHLEMTERLIFEIEV